MLNAVAAVVAPVPPFAIAIVVAFQVPAVSVPTPVILVKEPAVRSAFTTLAQVPAPAVLSTETN